MKIFQSKQKLIPKDDIKLNLNKFNIKNEFIDDFKNILDLGVKNYTLFQKHSNYSWPIWIHYSLNHENKYYRTGIPPILFNNVIRDGITFTNYLSDEYLLRWTHFL